ncbi:putative phospholipid-binding protein mlaC precursor [Rickettsiales bacterium Ac37b]|nr:putative phospholipid-binding protein mlaC precursor [Rickettsiales bacterium Ac37b]
MKCSKNFMIILLSFFIISYNIALAQETGTEQQVRDFVNNIGNKTLAIIQNTHSTPKEKEEVLKQLFINTVDITWMGDFVLGKYLRSLDDKQLTEYRTLYKQYLINSYVPKFKQYTQESFKITNVNKRNDNEYIVYTVISRPNGQSIAVNYMIRGNNNQFMVFDIIAEGVSLIVTTKSDFSSIITNGNNQIEALFAQLKNNLGIK